MRQLSLIIFSIVVTLSVSDAYKILVVFPLPSKSHETLGNGVVKHLLNAGHEVTFITPFPKFENNSMLHEIDLSSNEDVIPKYTFNLKNIMESRRKEWVKNFLLFITLSMAKKSVEQENFQKFLADQSQKFDLVIAEWLFSELYAGIATIYDAPLIWISSLEPHWAILSLIDEYLNPSYNTYDVVEQPPLSFLNRANELWYMIKHTILRETIIHYMHYVEYQRLIVPHIEARGKIVPSYQELRYSASLVLGNSHVSMGQATRLPQNYKPIGGYHIDDVKQLPEDLKKIIEDAKHGVIYFSMGSILKSKEMPDEVKSSLLKMFATLKQVVIWKFEDDLPNKPKNVHILKWAPQQSILVHPNVLIFITHGGLLSTTEAIFAGKPIIGIPVFSDQFTNVERAVNRGFAKKVDLSYSMADHLKISIDDILSSPKYAEKAKELSLIHHDRPVKPGQELVHWCEHVIKTKGAPHLRSPALLVPWYQKIYLDLIILLALVSIAIKFIYRKVKSFIFSKKTNNKQKTS